MLKLFGSRQALMGLGTVDWAWVCVILFLVAVHKWFVFGL